MMREWIKKVIVQCRATERNVREGYKSLLEVGRLPTHKYVGTSGKYVRNQISNIESDVGTTVERNAFENRFPMRHQQGIENNLLLMSSLSTSLMRQQQVIPDVHSFDVSYVLEITTSDVCIFDVIHSSAITILDVTFASYFLCMYCVRIYLKYVIF